MKTDVERLSTTAARVLELAPTARTMREIADQVWVTRERVRQILLKHGVERFRRPRTPVQCPCCKRPALRTGLCRECRQRRDEARYQALRITLRCEVCGTPVLRLRSRYLIHLRRGCRHIFCGKRCQGVWLGAQRVPAVLVQRTCETCGRAFSVRAWALKKRACRFCSHACCDRSRQVPLVMVTCRVCGAQRWRPRGQVNQSMRRGMVTCCSNRCALAWMNLRKRERRVTP